MLCAMEKMTQARTTCFLDEFQVKHVERTLALSYWNQ